MSVPVHVADAYYTFESRLASFQNSQPLSKRRGSNASSKAPKSIKWPHKFLAPEQLAEAGFFYHPLPSSTDNCACFLCRTNLDGWEKGDNPLQEHLAHSPDCGWAIVTAIEYQLPELCEEYPLSVRMIQAREATFADKWPHENKKGWKCKVKQMVDAGWKYTPTPEFDDTASCTYCEYVLEGWAANDKPMDEHQKRKPECAFFSLINNHQPSPAEKKVKGKKARASRVSRLSTQSSFTVASDVQSVEDLAAEEGDSVLTTATNATATRKMAKGKKPATGKAKKTRAKKIEPSEVTSEPEPEPEDMEMVDEPAPKPTRGRKRKTEDVAQETLTTSLPEVQPAKRRATRTRGSVAVDNSILDESVIVQEKAPKKTERKGRASTRKTSAASTVTAHDTIPKDDEIDAALEADLQRPLTDDEEMSFKASTRSAKPPKSDHAMFGMDSVQIDEAEIEAELDAMEADSKPLPKARGAKAKQPRKVSAKQQAAAAKKAAAAEAEAAAQRAAEDNVEDEDPSQQIVEELEQSISVQISPPTIKQPKRQQATSRQDARQGPGRNTRASIMSTNDSVTSVEGLDQRDDSGNETDASIASQSTIVRGGKNVRSSTMKKKGGKKVLNKKIEEIANKPVNFAVDDTATSTAADEKATLQPVDTSMEDRFFTPAPEMEPLAEEQSISRIPTPKVVKGKGRPKSVMSAASPVALTSDENLTREDVTHQQTSPPSKAKIPKSKLHAVFAARSATPPPREQTPSQSPQSSDAENKPPSSKPSTAKNVATPHTHTTRIPLAASTPILSPSKRNVIAGLQSENPWTAVDLDDVFFKSPSNENSPSRTMLGDAMIKAKNGDLTSPEKAMTVEEWIRHNAVTAEEKLRNECERMVNVFESQGTRAMRALEGIECLE